MGKNESVDMINSTKRRAIKEFKEPVLPKNNRRLFSTMCITI